MSSHSDSKLEVLLYAELLANIRQIRLFVTIVDPDCNTCSALLTSQAPDSVPILELSPSRSTITVLYRDNNISLQLPVPVSQRSREYLKATGSTSIPFSGDHSSGLEHAFRLPIDETAVGTERFPGLRDGYGSESPWSAKSMSPQTRISCRNCFNPIFTPQPGQTVEWKDLPSADWAEMMELWHCHKPDPKADQDVNLQEGKKNDHSSDLNEHVKGYGATNRVISEPGIILVNVSSFVMVDDDCKGVKKLQHLGTNSKEDKPSTTQEIVTLYCESCETEVGGVHNTLRGLEIFKAKAAVSKPTNATSGSNVTDDSFETYPTEIFIAAQLLESIERTGARRFVIHSWTEESERNTGLLIWVFNPDLRYSCNNNIPSIRRVASGQRALKVFFQSIPDVQSLVNPAIGTPAAASLEEILLPWSIYTEAKSILTESNSTLPPSARKFKEWDVGLLNLFGEVDHKAV
ncbi:hypothetical protein FQN57_005501 [Myotisia sp. PD_48]|nr:hypothetical protein FQN57_005501 [Myotisia sp. PD_48]